jgi:hypothetical protein
VTAICAAAILALWIWFTVAYERRQEPVTGALSWLATLGMIFLGRAVSLEAALIFSAASILIVRVTWRVRTGN